MSMLRRSALALLATCALIFVVAWGSAAQTSLPYPAKSAAQVEAAPPGALIPITFQQGVTPADYAGCRDTHLNQWLGYRDSNYCSSSTIEVRTGDQRAALIIFNVSRIPTSATVVSAELDLYLEWSTNPGLSAPVAAYEVLRPWTACQATWERPNSDGYWQMAGCNGPNIDRAATPASTIIVTGQANWHSWDLTALVQEWVAQPSANYGIVLKSFWQDYSLAFAFASAGHGGTQLRPKLNVVYSVPPATPTRTRTNTPSPTRTPTASPSATRTSSPTPTFTPTAGDTATQTATPTETSTPTVTQSPSVTATPSWTPTLTLTSTLSPTPSSTRTPEPASSATATATDTGTPTATPTVTGLLLGSVNLQGRPVPPSSAWRVELTVFLYQGQAEMRQFHVSTDDTGDFALAGIPVGTYDVVVKGAYSLRNRRNGVSIVPGAAAVQMGTLIQGDENEDNQIDIVDYSLFRVWYEAHDLRADFNEDGIVDLLDFSLLRSNFGLSGDIVLP